MIFEDFTWTLDKLKDENEFAPLIENVLRPISKLTHFLGCLIDDD